MRKNLSIALLSLVPLIGFGQQAARKNATITKSTDTRQQRNVNNTKTAKFLNTSNQKKIYSFNPQAKAPIFQEDFDGNGPGISAWTVIDADGLTPNPNVAFITSGWNSIDKLGDDGNFGGPAGDFAAMSTSWYNPAGTSNDWLITPEITIPEGNSTFKWQAIAQDPDFPDGYKVMLAPNGGNTIADFTVELYSTTGENPNWTTRSVDTTPYAGTNVRIAFVNNSTDMFMLLIDNISLSETAPPTGDECPWTVTIDAPDFGDEVSWELRDASGVILSGGDYFYESDTQTATAEGPVEFYIEAMGNYDDNIVSYSVANGNGILFKGTTSGGDEYTYSDLSCEDTPPPPPADCADFVALSNNLENGSLFGTQRVATDLPLADKSFTISGIEPTIIGEATNFQFIFHADDNGIPGAEIETKTGSIMGDVVTGNNFGFDFHKYSIAFDSPITLDANTTYWLEIVTDADGWESTTASSIGSPLAFNNENTAGEWRVDPSSEVVFNLICEDLAVNNVSKSTVSFYPNPVKDELNITSKEKVTSVSVYNIAGQKVLNNAQLRDGKINMSQYTPGTYIVTVILENGRTETFKAIKK